MSVILRWGDADPGRRARRLRSIPAVLGLGILYLAALPLALPLFALADAIRGRWRLPTPRLALVGANYLRWEYIAVTMGAVNWLRAGGGRHLTSEAWVRRHRHLQSRWSDSQVQALQRICGLRIEVSGEGDLAAPGPTIIFCRHASIIDTMVPLHLLQNNGGPIQLRYVMKNELLVDPALDVIGNRIPNHFVDRSGERRVEELATIRELAGDMAADEGLVIFPEGSRFSESKRAARLDALRDNDPTGYAVATRLRRTLPIRPGGPLAALAGAPNADVILIAHTGLEGLSGPKHVWARLPFRNPLKIRWRRIPRADIPTDPDDQVEWLAQQWQTVDDWIDQQHS